MPLGVIEARQDYVRLLDNTVRPAPLAARAAPASCPPPISQRIRAAAAAAPSPPHRGQRFAHTDQVDLMLKAASGNTTGFFDYNAEEEWNPGLV